MKSRIHGLIPVASIALLGACAHSPMASTSSDKDIAVSEQVTPRVPGLYSQDEFPDMTPEEMGRRFLRFIDSLQSYEQLTQENLEQVMQLKLDGPEGEIGGQFNVRMPESGWNYAVVYVEEENPPHPRVRLSRLHFAHRDIGRADMEPVCRIDFDTYRLSLEKAGFVYRKDLELYDVGPTVPLTNERGETEYRTMIPGHRLSPFQFSREDVMVSIDVRSETTDRSSPRFRHACVTRVVVGPSAASS